MPDDEKKIPTVESHQKNSTTTPGSCPGGAGPLPEYKIGTITPSDVIPDKAGHICINGKTASGKSHLIKHLIHNLVVVKKMFEYVVLFGANADREEYDYIPTEFRINKVTPEIVKAFWSLHAKRYKSTGGKSKCIFILDDILGVSMRHSSDYNDLLGRGRHDGIMCIIGVQHFNHLSQEIRFNFKQVILTTANNLVRKAVLDTVDVPDEKLFKYASKKLIMGKSLYLNDQAFIEEEDRVKFLLTPAENIDFAITLEEESEDEGYY